MDGYQLLAAALWQSLAASCVVRMPAAVSDPPQSDPFYTRTGILRCVNVSIAQFGGFSLKPSLPSRLRRSFRVALGQLYQHISL